VARCISHSHADHLNGSPGQKAILRTDDDPLAGKPAHSTVELKVTGGTSTVVDGPRELAPGEGTTSAVPVGLFGSGYTLEQGAVVDLGGKDWCWWLAGSSRRRHTRSTRRADLPAAGVRVLVVRT
jgi:hypothetical protein